MISLLLSALASATPCLTPQPDVATVVQPPAQESTTHLILEVHVQPGHTEWADRILGELEQRELAATVIVDLHPDDALDILGPWLVSATERDHEIALLRPDNAKTSNPTTVLKEQAIAVRKLTRKRPHALVTSLPSTSLEFRLVGSGFTTLLAPSGGTEALRPALTPEGQPPIGAVIPPGPYDTACGPSPVAGPFWSRVADRATTALRGAAEGSHLGFFRVGLSSQYAWDGDHKVFAQWLDEIVEPTGTQVHTASRARPIVRQVLRDTYRSDATRLPEPRGRPIPIEDVQAAAAQLDGQEMLPHRLAGDLSSTEAFVAFALLLTDDTEGTSIRMRPLRGPRTLATTTLSGPVTVSGDETRSLAKQLLTSLPEHVPAALPAGGHLLTASEVLVLMASAVRGEEPAQTFPIQPPEPNDPGLGWDRMTE